MLALDFLTFLENRKMSSSLSKILETGINVFKINYKIIKIKIIMNYYFSAGLEVARDMQMNKRNQDTAQSSRTPRQEFPSDTNSINGKWK